MKPIRIAVIDDHPLFREGVVRSLSEIEGFQIVGQGASAADAVAIARERSPDVVLMDVSMPGNGLAAIGAVLGGCLGTKVIMLTVSESGQDVARAVGCGAAGYVLKGVGAHSLAEIIRTVARGEAYVSPSLSAQLFASLGQGGLSSVPANPLSVLNDKELEILTLVGSGQSNKRVALTLSLHEKSIKRHLTQIFRKLKVSNRTEAAMALRDFSAMEPRTTPSDHVS
jgi:DNA-binding NarL/FixJ family response regulator